MRTQSFFASLSLLAVAACAPESPRDIYCDSDNDDPACKSDWTGETAYSEVNRPDPVVDWDEDGLILTLSGEEAYLLGMAETGAQDNGWAGEDCLEEVPEDNAYRSMEDAGFDLCHPFDPGGGSLESVGGLEDVEEGETTLFHVGIAEDITYVLIQDDADACWVWGDDPRYYEELSCTEIEGDTSGSSAD